MPTTNASRFGLTLYGVGLGSTLVANIAGRVMQDRVFLWMGVVGLVAIAVGMTMGVVAQPRGRIARFYKEFTSGTCSANRFERLFTHNTGKERDVMLRRISSYLITVVSTFSLAACASAGSLPTAVAAPAGSTGVQVAVDTGASRAQESMAAESPAPAATTDLTYPVVDTGQSGCYDNSQPIACPQEGQPFYGQDANYQGAQPAYVDNDDGTVSDQNTGLMWTQAYYGKMTWEEALASADSFTLAGYDDWRLPTIKELYSLIDFDGSGFSQIPYIDTDYFAFDYGDTSIGERTIDAQYWSSTAYVGTVFDGMRATFGVNFADGRIKGYPTQMGRNGGEMTQFVRYVRGNPDYGVNDFVDNGDGTITDRATGLTWTRSDSGSTMLWADALAYCESLSYADRDDWRLPNAKELHSIVDYSRAPTVTGSAAIDPLFEVSEIESWYWTGTTLLESPDASQAIYIAFGRAFGVPNGVLTDVHGAGAQRGDPKTGDPADYANGRGSPGQDDQVRIYNYARCVTGGQPQVFTGGEVQALGGAAAGQQPPSGQQAPPSQQQPPGGQPPSGGPPPPPR